MTLTIFNFVENYTLLLIGGPQRIKAIQSKKFKIEIQNFWKSSKFVETNFFFLKLETYNSKNGKLERQNL